MWTVLYVLLGLLALFVVICVLTWFLYVPMIARLFSETPWLQADSMPPVPDAEPCQFVTTDHLVLRGSYLRTTASRRLGVILFCHEYGGDRWGAVPYTSDLRRRGFDIFTFDFRNHGSSDRMPGYQPKPWLTSYELADVKAAIHYVCDRDDADPNGIGVIGISRGGNAALCAAAADDRIRALVTDGAFPIRAMQRHYIRRFMDIYITPWRIGQRLPDVCLVSYCEWAKMFAGWQHNCRFISPEQFIRRLRQPVFMIHGERDAYIPLEIVHHMRSQLGGRSKLWVVPGVKHNGAIKRVTEEYQRRLARFFEWQLAGGGLRSQTLRLVSQDETQDALTELALNDQSSNDLPHTPDRNASV